MSKHQDPINVDLLTFQQLWHSQRRAQHQPLLRSRSSGVRVKNMATLDKTKSLAMDPVSGVADIAFQRIGRHTAYSSSPVALTLATCSRNHRTRWATPIYPAYHPRQCTCLWDANIWLCRTCRMSILSIGRDSIELDSISVTIFRNAHAWPGRSSSRSYRL
jgi:hypothetical protein